MYAQAHSNKKATILEIQTRHTDYITWLLQALSVQVKDIAVNNYRPYAYPNYEIYSQ